MAIKVVINPANIGPDISLRVIFLNKHPSAEPNKIWTEITTMYIGIASTNWKICENADKIMRDGFLLGAHHGMTLDDVDRVCNLLKNFAKGK